MPRKIQNAEQKAMAEDPYRNLVVAIFEQAVKDLRSENKGPQAKQNRKEAKHWFKSPYFGEFCADFMDYDNDMIAKIREKLGITPQAPK